MSAKDPQMQLGTADGFLLRFSVSNGAKVWQSCRSRQMEHNDYLIAKIGADTAENEPSKVRSFG